MELLVIMSMVVASTLGYAPLREPGSNAYNDATFIQDLMERINRDMEPDTTYMDFGNKMDGSSSIPLSFVPGRTTKDSEFFDENDYDLLMGTSGLDKSIRVPEYLEHSSLYGHKLMSGGSGEPGSLKVKGQKVPTQVKSDAVLPAYCNPPNPCPVGHTADDGCLEIFENTAAFSRAYQASQDCMCDTEHMFDCHASSSSQEADDESDLTIGQSPFLSELQQVDGEHKRVVAKKFYNKKAPEQTLSRLNVMARNAAAVAHDSGIKLDENPYLQGEKLPIAAKKGHHAL